MNKTPDYRLRANENYEKKVIQRTIRFKPDDQDLFEAFEADRANNKENSLNGLIMRLLRKHYNL